MKKLFLILALCAAGTASSAQCNGVVFKVDKGRLEKYSNSGSYQEGVTTDVSDYDCNSEVIVVVKLNGRVEKYSFSGNYQGSITDDATRVRVNGNMLLVTKKNGRTEKYSFSGNYLGSI